MSETVEALAPVSAGLWTFFAVANLWIAGRVLQASGRAPRPMPDLPGMQFPKSASLAFIAAAAISAAGGTIGLYAQAALGGLVVAFALLGLAVVHGYTRAMALRGPILVGVYLVTIVFPWSLGILALIGLADTWLDLRANRPPTAGNDNSG